MSRHKRGLIIAGAVAAGLAVIVGIGIAAGVGDSDDTLASAASTSPNPTSSEQTIPPGTKAETSNEMPDVVGEPLDVALFDLDRIGIRQQHVRVVVPESFGAVDLSFWLVCEQEPAAGEPPVAVSLMVKRQCHA